MMVRTMRFFSRASVVGADQTVLRFDASRPSERGSTAATGMAAAVARDAVLGACVLQRQLAPAALAADQPGEERVAMLGRAVMLPGGNVAADHFADRFRPLPA